MLIISLNVIFELIPFIKKFKLLGIMLLSLMKFLYCLMIDMYRMDNKQFAKKINQCTNN